MHANPPIPDGWQVQVQARVQERARVLLRSGISPGKVRSAHLEPIEDIANALGDILALQPDARVCVLPEGPQTVPYLD